MPQSNAVNYTARRTDTSALECFDRLGRPVGLESEFEKQPRPALFGPFDPSSHASMRRGRQKPHHAI